MSSRAALFPAKDSLKIVDAEAGARIMRLPRPAVAPVAFFKNSIK